MRHVTPLSALLPGKHPERQLCARSPSQEQFFGNEFAAGYMEGVMFDVSEKTPVRRGASAAASS